jgi:NADPH2:quinone reductase
MKALIQHDDGFRLADVAPPAPGPEEVLVRVRACALNRADLLMLAGQKHGAAGGAGTVLGMEWMGEVVEVGKAVTAHRPGDQVMCSGKGGFAEYAVADHGRVIPVPSSGMSDAQAACLPVALQTMHDAIATNGQLRPGQQVLIQGASSGVGLMGLRIAKLLGAGQVIGTSTHAQRRERLAEFGADAALDSSDPGWVDRVLELTGGRGVDLVIDQLSGSVMNQNLRATAILGRIVNVGRLAGKEHGFDFDLHALRRISYVGVTFRTRSVEEVREINRRMLADLRPALQDGRLNLPIDSTYPLADAGQAFERMKRNEHFGKIVLQV